ncbi:hypothetical protein LI328DRAFT_26465 [Trichoderma asperelloides]|nr:hypothetical protein LI328DRAFT_26465 [Trichoderma asperelloides]
MYVREQASSPTTKMYEITHNRPRLSCNLICQMMRPRALSITSSNSKNRGSLAPPSNTSTGVNFTRDSSAKRYNWSLKLSGLLCMLIGSHERCGMYSISNLLLNRTTNISRKNYAPYLYRHIYVLCRHLGAILGNSEQIHSSVGYNLLFSQPRHQAQCCLCFRHSQGSALAKNPAVRFGI